MGKFLKHVPLAEPCRGVDSAVVFTGQRGRSTKLSYFGSAGGSLREKDPQRGTFWRFPTSPAWFANSQRGRDEETVTTAAAIQTPKRQSSLYPSGGHVQCGGL